MALRNWRGGRVAALPATRPPSQAAAGILVATALLAGVALRLSRERPACLRRCTSRWAPLLGTKRDDSDVLLPGPAWPEIAHGDEAVRSRCARERQCVGSRTEPDRRGSPDCAPLVVVRSEEIIVAGELPRDAGSMGSAAVTER